MVVTLLPIVALVMLTQFMNEEFPIPVHEDPMITSFSVVVVLEFLEN